MGSSRLLFALACLAAFAGALWWQWDGGGSGAPRPSGDFAVYVVGPHGLLHNGTVHVSAADPLAVLHALARERSFGVTVDDLAGCQFDYVRSIAGYGETATGGWNYYLRRADADPGAGAAAWLWQDRAASCPGTLLADDGVLWCWVEPDERCAVYPG